MVYIAGSSFSGSTLLGLILGTDENTVFIGEANQCTRQWRPRKGAPHPKCTCGEPIETCAFWSDVRRRYDPDVELNPSPGLSLLNLRLMLRILSPFPLPSGTGTVTPYGSLLDAAAEVARTEKAGPRLIIDSSKSIHGLDALARSPNIDLVVVHLIRDCAGVADSYKGRGSSALYGMLAWALVNGFLRLYSKRRRLRTITVDYEALCTSTEAEIARLNRALGTSLSAEHLPGRIRAGRYHVFAGNKGVRLGSRDITRIEYRGDAGRLGRFERFAAAAVQRILYRVLGAAVRADSR